MHPAHFILVIIFLHFKIWFKVFFVAFSFVIFEILCISVTLNMMFKYCDNNNTNLLHMKDLGKTNGVIGCIWL